LLHNAFLQGGQAVARTSKQHVIADPLLRTRLFLMMALQTAVWGAWAPKLFPYMTMLGFSAAEQAVVGSFCLGSV
jgi:hypothetical protein